jgi:predicted DNA-binding protein (MmcQ/YjbR family)
MAKQAPIDYLREICLALPEATEKEAWGNPTFRIRDKMFVKFTSVDRNGRTTLWCSAAPGAQDALLGTLDDAFFKPPYVGDRGWLGMYLDGDVNWGAVTAIVEDAYRMTAPKTLAATLDA